MRKQDRQYYVLTFDGDFIINFDNYKNALGLSYFVEDIPDNFLFETSDAAYKQLKFIRETVGDKFDEERFHVVSICKKETVDECRQLVYNNAHTIQYQEFPKQIIINTEQITFKPKEIDLDIVLPQTKFHTIDSIVINGFRFTREKEDTH